MTVEQDVPTWFAKGIGFKLTYLNPANVHVALGMLGPSGTTTACSGANSGAYGLAASSGTWIVSS